MANEWVIQLSKLFGSDIAVGFYITATIVMVPLALYFVKRGTWKERAAGYIILTFYALLTLLMIGLLGQQFYGNGINVLIALVFLLVLLMVLDPVQNIVKPKPNTAVPSPESEPTPVVKEKKDKKRCRRKK